ncbi:uncharacterized protein LOC101898529 [Musca domestica]|uniref:Uncharacterized protein LOC101898529 n=1 Tax=Musca domestica TaxID=7370 RepID=A0A9J7IFT6_MUSDO|nr:uncharacterized protein LOC101898529 [Musca domestica]
MAQNMLASRGMRFLMTRCRPAPLYTWTVKSSAPTMTTTASTTTTWYIRPIQPPMTAAYSKDTKNIFTTSMLIQKHFGSNAAPQPSPITKNNEISTSQASSSSSSSTKPLAPSTMESQAKPLIEALAAAKSSPTTSSTSATTSCSSKDPCSKFSSTKPPKSPPDSPIQPPNIKLPNRDQVEKYFFTALIYVWDLCYYVFCLTLRLIDTYILKNPTLQQYWKQFMKRLDEQREAMKSRK